MLRFAVSQLPVAAILLVSTGVCAAESPSINEAVRLIRSGALEEGAALLNAAIEAKPEHAANRSPIDGSGAVGAKALAHGREQFQRLAKDWPEILQGDKHFETLRNWAIREFAGAGTGFLVDWDSGSPILQAEGAHAEHLPPSRSGNAKIRIATAVSDKFGEGRRPKFEELWHHLAFEFYNLRGTSATLQLDERASTGDISRVPYVVEMFRLEHTAVQLTHRFYAVRFLPCAAAAQMQSDPYHWFVLQPGWWQPAEDFIDRWPFDAYPWKHFGDRYDDLSRSGRAHAAIRAAIESRGLD